ncbi:MAG TPA: discoidin domain-containing protein, partial [Luteolibacter sp.]
NISAFAQAKGPAWGYATSRDNAIYLHFIKGPDGKKGYTGEASVTIGPVKHKVQQVLWLNENKPLRFEQSGDSLTVTLQSITADPIDTIVKIVTDNRARKYHLTHIAVSGRQLAANTLQVVADGYATYPALKVPFTPGAVKFTSSNPAVATVSDQGLVTAASPGKASITVATSADNAQARNTLEVVVNSAKQLRVAGPMLGAVMKVAGKETYLDCAGNALPFTVEGRSLQGGPIALHAAKVTLKCGVVDYAKGTPYQPVMIEEKPVVVFSNGSLKPSPVKELTRAAVWAEIDLDGVKTTTNKVFLDLEPVTPVSIGSIAASSNLGDFSASKVNDGVIFPADGTDSSKWSAAGNQPSWLAFDFKKPQKVSLVSIHFNMRDQAFINTPESMEIQASADGRQWTTLATVNPPASGSGAYFGFPNTFRFKPAVTRYLRLAFPKGNPKGESVDLMEVSFAADEANNLATVAKISASSEFNDSYRAINVADGIVGENGNGEWASKGEADPWLKLEWSDQTRVTKVVLRDRPGPGDFLQQGTLSFSDGSSIEVAGIPDDGSPKTITFPAKNVKWLQFQATGNKPTNNGLSEFSVFGPQ